MESKKRYDRKKSAHVWKKDSGMGVFSAFVSSFAFPQGGLPLPALPAPVQHQHGQTAQANERQQRPQVRMAMVVGLGRGGRRILLLLTSFFDG